MEFLNHFVDPVIEHTYTINHPTVGVLVYKEWIDTETGQCIDYTLESEHGYKFDLDWDEDLIEEIQKFIDNNQNI